MQTPTDFPCKLCTPNHIYGLSLQKSLLSILCLGTMKFPEKLFQGSIKVFTETQGFVPVDHQNLSDKLSLKRITAPNFRSTSIFRPPYRKPWIHDSYTHVCKYHDIKVCNAIIGFTQIWHVLKSNRFYNY